MILLIDQGNTAIKWCLFDDNFIDSHNDTLFKPNSLSQFNRGSIVELEKFLQAIKELSAIYIASVKKQQITTLQTMLKNMLSNVPVHIAQTTMQYRNLMNGYENYHQMGIDRWLVMIALWQQFNKAFIVVDAGSALTLDIVNAVGEHQGGHIMPGLLMQKSLLLKDTDNIQISNSISDSRPYIPGRNTSTAVHNGCMTNLCSYVNNMYLQQENSDSLPLFITGGDAEVISQGLNVKHQIMSDLVFQGLVLLIHDNIES